VEIATALNEPPVLARDPPGNPIWQAQAGVRVSQVKKPPGRNEASRDGEFSGAIVGLGLLLMAAVLITVSVRERKDARVGRKMDFSVWRHRGRPVRARVVVTEVQPGQRSAVSDQKLTGLARNVGMFGDPSFRRRIAFVVNGQIGSGAAVERLSDAN
jgi:hypothetical protein